jgi:hypothetical protein
VTINYHIDKNSNYQEGMMNKAKISNTIKTILACILSLMIASAPIQENNEVSAKQDDISNIILSSEKTKSDSISTFKESGDGPYDHPPYPPINIPYQLSPIIGQWKEYSDYYWKFKIDIPIDWGVHNNPYVGLGYYMNSPDLLVDPLGNPIQGAMLIVQVVPQDQLTWVEYQADIYGSNMSNTITSVEGNGFSSYNITGIDESHISFTDRVFIGNGYIHRFHFITKSSLDYQYIFPKMISSLVITGRPVEYPGDVSPYLFAPDFTFTAIKLPFASGSGRIISGYGHQASPNQYAFDLCEGSECIQSQLDPAQNIISPTTMKYDWSMDSDGNGSLDFHFFEIANDGSNKMCTQMGHFKLGITGLSTGTEIPRGAAIGSIVTYSPSIPHIHMGLYTIPSSYRCAGDPTKRVGVPFSSPYTLDGVSYPVGQNHQWKTVTSTNAPFCWMPSNSSSMGSIGNIESPSNITSICFPESDTTSPSGYFTAPSNGSVINSRSVAVSVNATDNSGGSGVREVRFSAKWGGTWYGIGTDGDNPYTINWDMCNSNVPDGDIELGMEVWDNEGNVYIWSDHGSNPHITKNYTCSQGDQLQGGPWNVQAWQNSYLAGYSNWDGTITWNNGYPYIWFDLGGGNDPFGWGGDNYSMRLIRNVYFPGGYYDFHVDHDDGGRLYVDGQLTVDAWWDGHGEHAAGKNLSQGNHEIKVEYYEKSGDSILKVFWYGAGYPKPDTNPPTGRITYPTDHSASRLPSLHIAADAWDDASGINQVTFYAWYCDNNVCDWRTLFTDYTAPYQYDWDWSALGDKHIWLDILAYDNLGKYSYNADGWVEVDYDSTPPITSMNYPTNNQVLRGNQVPISVYAYDQQSGIASVQFYVGYDDGSGDYWHELGWDTQPDDTIYSYNWNGSSFAPGKFVSFFAYAYDKAGNYSGVVSWNTLLNGKSFFAPIILRP